MKAFITVSELNEYIGNLLARDDFLSDFWIKGEISGFKYYRQSGHMYFNLKDRQAAVSCVMFRSRNQGLKFQLEDGLEVLARVYVSVYPRQGKYQVYVQEMQPYGKGGWYLQLEQLKKKLEAAGYFLSEKKKAIPPWVNCVGIVTSQDGAALKDILRVIRQRHPGCEVILVHSSVQGETAPSELAEEKNSWLNYLEEQLQRQKKELVHMQEENGRLQVLAAELKANLEEEKRKAEDNIALLKEARENLLTSFQALSAEALKNNNQAFLELARNTLDKYQQGARGELEMRQKAIDHLVQPLQKSLQEVNEQIKALEKERAGAYASLSEQIKSMATAQGQLQYETAALVKALRTPAVRGRWGEIQLRRVVEVAGMLPYCDFVEQASVNTDGQRLMRPDMIVKLPGGRNVVIDSKAPLQAYLEAIESVDEEEKTRHLKDHARQVKSHISNLASKSYWEQFEPHPEFVVLFLPGESFFSAALEQQPQLIEYGAQQKLKYLNLPTRDSDSFLLMS
jgi:DNA anti-recombination protein RmuC